MSDREYLGRGWRFPVAVSLTGGLATSSLEESVRQSIFVLLGTAPGERLMRPHFGCRIHELVFAPNTPITAGLAEYYVKEAILKFEPRVQAVAVTARPSADANNKLDIQISYTLRDSNHERNLVYPFYLQGPEDEE